MTVPRSMRRGTSGILLRSRAPFGKLETSDSPQEIGEARVHPLALALATGLGTGYAPVASGTFGSMVAVVLYPLIAGFGLWLYLLITLALLSAGVWAADEFERVHHLKDDGRIVADEIVGQLITYFPFLLFDVPAGFFWLVTGFVVFRGFDIWKPGPASWAEQNFTGGAGVMLDDVVAGVMGAGTMTVLIFLLWMFG